LPSEDPVADFTTSHTIATTLDFVEFFDESSDYDGDIATWNWDFGDNSLSSLHNPAHRYTQVCPPIEERVCKPILEAMDTEGNPSGLKEDLVTIVVVAED
jgi:hypothetical protein